MFLLACADPVPGGEHTLAFAGLHSVTWDGADGLVLEWSAASGSAGGYRYTADVGGFREEVMRVLCLGARGLFKWRSRFAEAFRSV